MNEYLRLGLGVVYLVIIGGMLHELGHLGMAKLLNLEVLEYQISGLYPHVSIGTNTGNVTGIFLFLMAGLMTLPLYLIFHRLCFGGIYDYEMMYIVVIFIVGSTADFYKILLLFKIV